MARTAKQTIDNGETVKVSPLVAVETQEGALPVDKDDYSALRKSLCSTGSKLDVTTYERILFDKDPYICGGDVFSFYRGKDVQFIEPEAGEISIEREEVSGDSRALKQTEAPSSQAIEWKQEFPIQASYGSRLQSFLVRVLQDEFNSGRDGSGIIAYSNGGVHYEKIVVFNEGKADEFRVKMFFPNLKVESWPNVYMGDITSESTIQLNVLIENFPAIVMEGNVPDWYGIPTDLTLPVIATESVVLSAEGSLTVSGITLTDTDLVALDTNVNVKVYNITGEENELLVSEDVNATDSVEYTTGVGTEATTLMVVLSYYVSETLMYIGMYEEVTQTPALRSSRKAKTETEEK